ncbi:MAG: ribonuclease Y [Patescibacteria group bacterium]|nr:ribonuclease Y [Patescibacteria group bacterium]
MYSTYILLIAAGSLIGLVVGYTIRHFIIKTQIDTAAGRAEKLIADARVKQQELMLSAKEKAIHIIDEAKHEEEERRREFTHLQQRLEQRESLFDQKLLEFQEKQQKLYEKITRVEQVKEEVRKIREDAIAKLQEISGLTREQAEKRLLEATEAELKEEIAARIRKMENQGDEEIEKKSRELISLAIQRCAASQAQETTTTNVELPNDEMKGRIIGKEGRNIKTIEQLTGTEILIDDTPGMIMISGFSPIRRQLARIALQRLIKDGRIHPGRIEEQVEEAKKELAVSMKKSGEESLYETGVSIAEIDPKLVQILGRLKFRTSYGQNVLQHSVEVANLSTLIAQELGANVKICRIGGLFHDIGKAVDHDIQGSHPEIGYNIMKKFNFPEEIARICIEHHEDRPTTVEGAICKSADAISGARPGARKDTLEQYIQRLGDLEKTATGFAGVEKAYAIQAGREIRVFVTPTQIDDSAATKLAHDIAKKIEEELRYPGEIKVTVIRETRVIEYAR